MPCSARSAGGSSRSLQGVSKTASHLEGRDVGAFRVMCRKGPQTARKMSGVTLRFAQDKGTLDDIFSSRTLRGNLRP
jgi:hypothetical protein